MWHLLALLACTRDVDESDVVDEPPTLVADVVVVGSGPSGLAAAHMAAGAGLTVWVLEKQPEAGGSGWYAGRFLGVGTRFQRAVGVDDSVEAAVADWPELSGGGVVDDHVMQLLQRSTDVIEWLVGDLHAVVTNVTAEPGQKGSPRMHDIGGGINGPIQTLVSRLNDRLMLDTMGTELVFRDGRVVGCRYEDVLTGETGWIQADATIVASGGFARNAEQVLRDRPEFTDVPYLVEMGFPADGGGVAMLEAGGAQWQNRGAMGFYTHSIADPDRPGETLWPQGLQYGLFLDMNGERVANEATMTGFLLVDTLLAAPEQRLLAVVPASELNAEFQVPRYNVEATDPEVVMLDDLVARGVVHRYADAAALAAGLGMPSSTVEATFARYESMVDAGEDVDFQKSADCLRPVAGQPLVVLELRPGAAKSFSGFAVDVDGRVTAADGSAIPGLYAAGEAIGALGSPGVGRGISGSITAMYLTGMVAGETAIGDRAP